MNHFDSRISASSRTIVDLPLGNTPLKQLTVERQDPVDKNSLELDRENFKIRLANSEGKRESADLLIKKMYSWRGYDTVGALSFTPNKITLMADLKGQPIGTLSIGLDSKAGLLVDQLYKDEIDKLRGQDRLVCEFTKLAVDQGIHSKRVIAALFHLAYIYAHKINGVTDLVIEVNPRHVAFYKRMLGFIQLSEERICPRVNAPGVLLGLTAEFVGEQIAKFGGAMTDIPNVRSLYPYAFGREDEDGITQRLLRGAS